MNNPAKKSDSFYMIGRQLTVAFAEDSYITIAKRRFPTKTFKGTFQDHYREGHLEDIKSILGIETTFDSGLCAGRTYGMDVNHLISHDDCWLTTEELAVVQDILNR